MAVVTRLQVEHEKLKEANARLEEENRLLKAILRLMRLEKYGAKSEKLSDDQLELLEVEPGVRATEVETEVEISHPVKVREHAGRNALPGHLERREELVTSPERQCPCCGEARCVIGYEEKEVLDLEPASYFVRVIKREKLACRKCPEGGVATAPVSGPKIVEKGKLSDTVVVDVLIKKYASHLPLYRQQADLERDFGIELSRSTLNAAVLAAGELFRPMMDILKSDLLAGGYIQADETPIGVQSEQTLGRNHQAYEFQYSRPGGPVVFDFQMSRAREGPAHFLSDYGGILQCDGYAGYDKVGAPGMVRAGCMAHARRKFNEALKVDPQDRAAAEILAIMGKLYAVEKGARETKAGPAERLALRQEKSVAVFLELRTKIEQIALAALPASKLGQACSYALKQWDRLKTYLQNGQIEIDQNACENGMRSIALGRKNWIHIGSEDAGPRIAAILSIFETCKRLQINLRDYLSDVLPKLPDWPVHQVADLSPLRWRSP
ncbi:IS66-like element ISCro1 family transposase [soil metagenome]